MKKVLNLAVLFSILAVLMTSCVKTTDKILPRKDGKWNLKVSYVAFVNDVEEDKDEAFGNITFEGSNFTFNLDGDSESGTWTATDKQVILTVSGVSIEFDILESKKKSQKWSHSYSEVIDGYNYKINMTWDLTK